MQPLFWSVLFAVLMLCMIALELLTPAMGGFTFAALGCAAVSIFSGFQHSAAAGWTMLALNAVLFPAALFSGFHFLKRSRLVNLAHNRVAASQASDGTPLISLKGEVGRTLTDLRPAGAALINGSKIDVLSDGAYIESGSTVRVVRINGASVFVELASRQQ